MCGVHNICSQSEQEVKDTFPSSLHGVLPRIKMSYDIVTCQNFSVISHHFHKVARFQRMSDKWVTSRLFSESLGLVDQQV